MKYIVMQVKTGGILRELPIVFPEALTHATVAAALERHCPELRGSKPVAAGFLSCMAVGEKGGVPRYERIAWQAKVSRRGGRRADVHDGLLPRNRELAC